MVEFFSLILFFEISRQNLIDSIAPDFFDVKLKKQSSAKKHQA